MPMTAATANDIMGHEFGGTSYSVPTTHYYAAGRATTLSSAASATDTSLSVADSGVAFPVEGIIGFGDATFETINITDVSGTTLTISPGLVNSYSSGAYVLVNPASDGSGFFELTGGSYARVSVTNNGTNYDAAAAGVVDNLTAITFPNPTANLGRVGIVAIFTASSGGTMRHWDRTTNHFDIVNGGNPLQFAVGGMIHTGLLVRV